MHIHYSLTSIYKATKSSQVEVFGTLQQIRRESLLSTTDHAACLKVHSILKDSSPLPISCLNVSPQANISGPSKHDGLHD